jgi:hypothetical protein
VDANRGIPNITAPVYPGWTTYAFEETVIGDDNRRAMEAHLRAHGSDSSSRFAVLRYLWAASCASAAPVDPRVWDTNLLLEGGVEAVQREADDQLTASVRVALNDFVERLLPEAIPTPEQVIWEFKQALILHRQERLRRIADQHHKLSGRSMNERHLLLARALWLLNGHHWATFLLEQVSPGRMGGRLPWEAFIETGHPADWTVSLPGIHEPGDSRESVVDAQGCLKNVSPRETLGPHWFLLADCCAMLGEAEDCARIWEEHGAEILKPVADIDGRSAEELLALPDFQIPIANLWSEAGRPDKETHVLEQLRQREPRLIGINRRLAELYINVDPDLAHRRTLDEAGCDQVFSKDSIVRLLILQDEKRSEAERQRDSARNRYEESPDAYGQRAVIRNILALTWPTFARLSPSVQGDWVLGLWWCYGNHPAQVDEAERAEESIWRCARALEVHLREHVFEPLRAVVLPTERAQLADDKRLKTYLQGGHLELGTMLGTIADAASNRSGIYKRLWDLLAKRSSNPRELQSARYSEICEIRNSSTHESRSKVTLVNIDLARHFTELCQQFLSMLESPPAPPPGPVRPGQPIPKR